MAPRSAPPHTGSTAADTGRKPEASHEGSRLFLQRRGSPHSSVTWLVSRDTVGAQGHASFHLPASLDFLELWEALFTSTHTHCTTLLN